MKSTSTARVEKVLSKDPSTSAKTRSKHQGLDALWDRLVDNAFHNSRIVRRLEEGGGRS